MNTRKQLEKIYNQLYTVEYRGNRLVYAYCGDTRECLDHVPPLSVLDSYGTKKIKELQIECKLYPCCNKCNSLLGNKALASYEERLLFLYNKTMEEFDTKVFWSNAELEELEGHLKQSVTAKQLALRRDYLYRLRGMEENLAKL